MPRGITLDASLYMTLRDAFSGFRSHRVPRQPNHSHCLAQSISCRTRTVFVIRQKARAQLAVAKRNLAGWTGLEPATSDVTGRRSNQLNYHPAVGGRPRPKGRRSLVEIGRASCRERV